jgi:hypothetical protein
MQIKSLFYMDKEKNKRNANGRRILEKKETF